MTWEQAVLEAARKYWNSEEFDEMESFKDSKYTKKYFDGVREGLETEEPTLKKKKGK